MKWIKDNNPQTQKVQDSKEILKYSESEEHQRQQDDLKNIQGASLAQ